MYRKFVEFIKKNELLNANDNIVVGVSGGADSVCLLLLLCKLREEMPLDIIVAHINHGIRKEAVEDAAFVEKLCKEKELPFVLKEFSVNKLAKEWNMSSEEAGRKVRYETFSSLLPKEGGKIVVAHNQNDVAETVLFHLFRGSGSVGLTGIRPKNGNIVRPLLCFEREEIEKYLEDNKQEYCIDKTNLTDDYTRNKIRNHILPYVDDNIVKGSVSHIYNTANLLRQQEDYLEEETNKMFSKIVKKDENGFCYKIDRKKFLKLHVFLQKKVLYKAIEELSRSKKDITTKHIDGVLDLFEKEGMKYSSLPYNLQAKSSYDCICIEKIDSKEDKNLKESVLEDAEGFTFKIIFDTMPHTIEQKEYTKRFDYDKIEEVLKVRSWQEGDFLMVQNGQHKKSIHRYFIDEKIPLDKRKEVLLLADGSHILWVIGKRISDYYKITKDTKNIIEIHYNGGNENGKTSY